MSDNINKDTRTPQQLQRDALRAVDQIPFGDLTTLLSISRDTANEITAALLQRPEKKVDSNTLRLAVRREGKKATLIARTVEEVKDETDELFRNLMAHRGADQESHEPMPTLEDIQRTTGLDVVAMSTDPSPDATNQARENARQGNTLKAHSLIDDMFTDDERAAFDGWAPPRHDEQLTAQETHRLKLQTTAKTLLETLEKREMLPQEWLMRFREFLISDIDVHLLESMIVSFLSALDQAAKILEQHGFPDADIPSHVRRVLYDSNEVNFSSLNGSEVLGVVEKVENAVVAVERLCSELEATPRETQFLVRAILRLSWKNAEISGAVAEIESLGRESPIFQKAVEESKRSASGTQRH